MIQLVCFDLGGVWIRLSNGWPDILRRAEVDPSTHEKLLPAVDVFHDANHPYEVGDIDEQTFTGQIADHTGLDRDTVLNIFDAILVEPYPGIDRLLDQLEHTGVQTACLSNTNHTHWQTVTSPGPLQLPLHRLHHRFASHLVGHRKPNLEIYHHVQEQTDTPAQAIIFFDDNAENCLAAADLGWHAHRIDPTADPIEQVTTHLRSHQVL